MLTIYTYISIILAYLLGSISSAIIISKLLSLPDPRTLGSGNPGATNILRIAGKKVAIITLLGDVLKGFIAVLIASLVFKQTGMLLAIVGLAAFIGHLYPIFFGFKGGKGVATALGVMLALSPMPLFGLSIVATWGIVALIFRYSSLAALVSVLLSPFYALFFGHREYFIPLLLIALLLAWKHKTNIERLIQGTEPKIGKKTPGVKLAILWFWQYVNVLIN